MSTEGHASCILPLLLQISAVASEHSSERQATEIGSTARTCLNSALSIIPAAEFMSCAMDLLAGVGDKRVSAWNDILPVNPLTDTSDKIWRTRFTCGTSA